MIAVEINIPTELVGFSQAVVRALPEIAAAVHMDIVAMAQKDLKSSSVAYIQALQPVKHHPIKAEDLKGGPRDFATIVLGGGFIPQAVELGWSPLGTSRGSYDMKPALLAGKSSKPMTDPKRPGRYAIVSFIHSGQGSTNRYAASPVGSAEQRAGMSKTRANLLGKAVYKAASKLTPSTTSPKGGRVWGQRLASAVGGAVPLKSSHATDPYSSMHRLEKTYKNKTESQMSTFRTVSTYTDPSKWIHPGIKKHAFFEQAAKKAPKHAELAFKWAAKGLTDAR